MLATKLQGFANLLEISRLRAPGKSYEMQEELVASCRAEGRPFLATMPLRHRFRCTLCGVEAGEAQLHFEDPTQQLADPIADSLWGRPAGRYFAASSSSLHSLLEHSSEVPAEFVELLNDVRT
jgi:hypothetical protein